MEKKPNFDWTMHYFRAFAIVCIVALHVLDAFGYRAYGRSVFQSATIFFLFISGYLCQYLELKKAAKGESTPARVYYVKKLKNVIAPYLVWTTLILVLVLAFPKERFGLVRPEALSSLSGFFRLYFAGAAAVPYWYIPFVAVLFALSPLIWRLTNAKLMALTCGAGVAFLFLPDRPFFFYFNPPFLLNLYGHFFVFYLLGFVYARFKAVIDPWLRRYVWAFVLLSIALILPMWVREWYGHPLMHPMQAAAVQKLVLIPVAIVALSRLANRPIGSLDTLANLSFTIFFTHVLLIQPFVSLAASLGYSHPIRLALILIYAVVVYRFAALLKRLTGPFSRYLIGS